MVYHKLTAAIQNGIIRDGTTLVEISAGSTGLALAFAGNQLGYPVEIHSYESISLQKLSAIETLGARVCLHPVEQSMNSLFEEVSTKVNSGNYWQLGQFERNSVVESYETLAQEILQQLQKMYAEEPKSFLCAVGTGGVIQGVGRVLRKTLPNISIDAVEPEKGSSIDGMRNAELFHLGPSDSYDLSFPDRRFTVPPPKRAYRLNEQTLGQSACAVLELVTKQDWKNRLIIAPSSS